MDIFYLAYLLMRGIVVINGWFAGLAIGRKVTSEFAWVWALGGGLIVIVIQPVLLSGAFGIYTYPLWLIIAGTAPIGGWIIGGEIGKAKSPDNGEVRNWAVAVAIMDTVVVWFAFAIAGACC